MGETHDGQQTVATSSFPKLVTYSESRNDFVSIMWLAENVAVNPEGHIRPGEKAL